MKTALGFFIVCGILGALPVHAQEERLMVQWRCADTGKDSMQCAIRNNKFEDSGLCMDVVKVCKDGDHVVTVCSALLKQGETDIKVVAGFQPKIRYFSHCMGTEYRNKRVMH